MKHTILFIIMSLLFLVLSCTSSKKEDYANSNAEKRWNYLVEDNISDLENEISQFKSSLEVIYDDGLREQVLTKVDSIAVQLELVKRELDIIRTNAYKYSLNAGDLSYSELKTTFEELETIKNISENPTVFDVLSEGIASVNALRKELFKIRKHEKI